MDTDISQLQSRLDEIAAEMQNPDISPVEYAVLSAEYTSIRRQIVQLRVQSYDNNTRI
jgi:hypothetical protein